MRATVSSAAVRLVPADSMGREALSERDGEIRAALVYRAGELPGVLQIAAHDAEQGGFRLLTAPAAEPASLACERLGARADMRQHEMRLTL
jgi:hypothetical protein